MTTATDATCRPPNQNDTLPRDDPLHEGKTFKEGAPAEELGFLGWEFDLNRLLIKLPIDKLRGWSKDITPFSWLASSSIHYTGRLQHTNQHFNLDP
jgi:hypothetical protein